MRTALAALMLAIAGFVVDPYGAFAQEPGQLRITVRLTDHKTRVTYPAARETFTITGDAGSPAHRVETGPEGTVDTLLAPGTYLVESFDKTEFQGRYYRWSQRVVVPAGAVIVLGLTDSNGQSTPKPTRTLGPLPFVAPFVQYGAPQRLTGGLSVLFPIGRIERGELTYGARGIEFQASGGDGGWRVAIGAFYAAFPLWTADVLLTVTRTTADTRGALPESTYVGVEAGLKAYVWSIGSDSCLHDCRHVLLMFKPSVGFAHRVDGPAGLKRTMFTWSTGGQALSLTF
jgi:hypothetical protein